jgi:glycosyltransferase involved in cell wall biosynthesis
MVGMNVNSGKTVEIDVGPPFPVWPITAHAAWMEPEGNPDLVSVILPTYNRDQFLSDAIESAWMQTYRPIELLVVDDGSTDAIGEVVEAWEERVETDADFDLRYVRQSNQGVSAARNHGLLRSRGEYIQYLDSDDVMHPQKIEVHVAGVEGPPRRDHVWSEAYLADAEGFGPFGAEHRDEFDADALVAGAEDGIPSLGGAHKGFFRRTACYRVGPWNERLNRMEDKEYNLRLYFLSPNSAEIKAPLYKMRDHDAGSLTDTKGRPAGVLNGRRTVEAMEQDLAACSWREPPAGFRLRNHYLEIAILALQHGMTAQFEELLQKAIDHSAPGREQLVLRGLRVVRRIFGTPLASWMQQAYTNHRLKA